MCSPNKKKALIAMSGGVDSSVAALITKNAGYDIVGCTMKLYDAEDSERTCCSLNDILDARNVASKLGAKHYVFNFKDEFKNKIIDKFIDFYGNGKTPNPCVDCNKYMKFDKLFDRANVLNCDYIVTGHYARIENKDGRYFLKKAIDKNKDQSYFLYQLSEEQLKKILFPLGEYTKDKIREIALENEFVNAKKPDSQDVCFVPNGDYKKVIETISNKKYEEGDFLLKDGTKIGRHKGIINYTIGQRKGLNISYKKPLYVVDIDVKNNNVILSDDDDLYRQNFIIKNYHFVSRDIMEKVFYCDIKIRYHHNEQRAKVEIISDTLMKISFLEPQRAITKGQSAVLYDGEYVLGGGEIFDVM